MSTLGHSVSYVSWISKGAETTLFEHLGRVSKLDVGEIRLVSLFSIADRSFSNSEPYSDEIKADRGSFMSLIVELRGRHASGKLSRA